MSKPCNDDSCDGGHCTRCGGHFFDFYSEDKMCDMCKMEIEQERQYEQRDTPLAEQLDDDQGVSDQFNPVNGEMD